MISKSLNHFHEIYYNWYYVKSIYVYMKEDTVSKTSLNYFDLFMNGGGGTVVPAADTAN